MSTKKKEKNEPVPQARSRAPKSVLDKIIYAIRNTPQTPNGVSRTAIAKYLKNELGYDNASALKSNLKKAVAKGTLIQTGQSFRVKGDKVASLPQTEKVEIDEVKVGKGDEAADKGDTVVVKYEGRLDDGTTFDSASSFVFTLGAGDVIKGWDLGIIGMKAGGKRKLKVPSKLGYGKRGSPPDIPPNATLHFDVTLKQISG